jgi:hypothetical protein
MSRPFSSNEPARQKDYRQLYWRFKNRLNGLEDALAFVSREIKEVRKQVMELKDDKSIHP